MSHRGQSHLKTITRARPVSLKPPIQHLLCIGALKGAWGACTRRLFWRLFFWRLTALVLTMHPIGLADYLVFFRGFAFVEFNALSDAKAAFKSLVHSTHLYGRRLVVEFASGDSSLEEMRSKTRKQWESGERWNIQSYLLLSNRQRKQWESGERWKLSCIK